VLNFIVQPFSGAPPQKSDVKGLFTRGKEPFGKPLDPADVRSTPYIPSRECSLDSERPSAPHLSFITSCVVGVPTISLMFLQEMREQNCHRYVIQAVHPALRLRLRLRLRLQQIARPSLRRLIEHLVCRRAGSIRDLARELVARDRARAFRMVHPVCMAKTPPCSQGSQ
jgi:hypothetical protein